jgi:hypothetical protein
MAQLVTGMITHTGHGALGLEIITDGHGTSPFPT